MEEEARLILRRALTKSLNDQDLASRIHSRFAGLGGVELDLPERKEPGRLVDLGQ
jgi:plasmid stability protein